MCFFQAPCSLDPSTALHPRFGPFSPARLIQHHSARPWGRAPPSSGRARGIFTHLLHCRPQKATRAHAHGPAHAGLPLLRTSVAAQRRPRAAGRAADGVFFLSWTATPRSFVTSMRLRCCFVRHTRALAAARDKMRFEAIGGRTRETTHDFTKSR